MRREVGWEAGGGVGVGRVCKFNLYGHIDGGSRKMGDDARMKLRARGEAAECGGSGGRWKRGRGTPRVEMTFPPLSAGNPPRP